MDVIDTPLRIIEDLFEKQKEGISAQWEVSRFFEEQLKNSWNKIPCLNGSRHDATLDKLRSGSLVRYLGMIQDIFDPEFYLGVYEEVDLVSGQKRTKSGKYQDFIADRPNIQIDPNAASSEPMDRLPLFCIPIPGQSPWSKTMTYTSVISTQNANIVQTNSKTKRKNLEEEEDTTVSMENESTKDSEINENSSQDKRRKTQQETMQSLDSNYNECYFPIPDTDGLACLVKIYDDKEGEFKLNEIVEFVGVLQMTPQSVHFPRNG